MPSWLSESWVMVLSYSQAVVSSIPLHPALLLYILHLLCFLASTLCPLLSFYALPISFTILFYILHFLLLPNLSFSPSCQPTRPDILLDLLRVSPSSPTALSYHPSLLVLLSIFTRSPPPQLSTSPPTVSPPPTFQLLHLPHLIHLNLSSVFPTCTCI